MLLPGHVWDFSPFVHVFLSCFVCYPHQCHLGTISYLAAAASSRSSWFPVFFLFSRANLIKLPEVSAPHCRSASLPQKSELQFHSHSLGIQGKYCRLTVAFQTAVCAPFCYLEIQPSSGHRVFCGTLSTVPHVGHESQEDCGSLYGAGQPAANFTLAPSPEPA